jgi:hypothetical protein
VKVWFATLGVALALAGCSSLPSTGPLSDDVVKLADNEIEKRYVLADVDDRTVSILSRYPGPSLRSRFGDYRPRRRSGSGSAMRCA